MRILAYAQILESYKSVTLESLSDAFGVSVDFIDRFAFFTGERMEMMLTMRTESSLDLSPMADYTVRSTRYTGSSRRRVRLSRMRSMRRWLSRAMCC